MSESECRDLSDGDINGRAVGTFVRSACEAQWTPAGTCFIYDDKVYYTNTDCGQSPQYHNHNLVCKREAASYISSDTGVCGAGYTSDMSESECRKLSDGYINGRAVGTFVRSACEAQWTPAGTCFIYDDKLYYTNTDCGQNPSYHNHNLVCKFEETEVAVTKEEADEAARRRRERAQARLARGPPVSEHEQENAVGTGAYEVIGNTSKAITIFAIIGVLTVMYHGLKIVHKMVFTRNDFKQIKNHEDLEV